MPKHDDVEVLGLARRAEQPVRRAVRAACTGTDGLASLCTIATRISDPLDLGAIADAALDYVLGLLSLEVGAVFLADEKTGDLQLHAHRCLPERFIGRTKSLKPAEAPGFGLVPTMDGQVRTGPVRRYPSLAEALRDAGDPSASAPPRPRTESTLISIPLATSDQYLGSLVVFSDGAHPLDDQETALLSTAVGQIATLVKNARLLAGERRQRRLAESLQKVAKALVSELDRETTLSSILEHLSRVMEYDGAAVLLLHDGLLRTVSARGFNEEDVRRILQVSLQPDEHPYLRRIIREGVPFIFPPEHRQDPFRGVLAMKTIHSTMAAPLKTKDGVIGVLTAHKIDPNWYDSTDLAALEAFGSHAALAIQNAELWAELKALSAQSIEALERERRRISRELHDEVGQALTATRITLERALRELPAELAEVRSRLEEGIGLTTQMLGDVRRLAYDLRPTVLDDLGLTSALKWYSDAFSRRTGLEVSFQASGLTERPPGGVETVLYRLVQEALTNIARHADAQHVRIELAGEPEAVSLRICDDGRGFDVAPLGKPWSPGQGLGLRGMRERVKLLGGALQVISRPGKGTELRARVPLQRSCASPPTCRASPWHRGGLAWHRGATAQPPSSGEERER